MRTLQKIAFGRAGPTLGGLLLSASWCCSAVAQTSPTAFTEGFRWDSMRRLVGKIESSASGTAAPFLAERYSYDADGQLIRTEKGYLSAWQAQTVMPANWTGYTVNQQVDVQYDDVGNKIKETTISGGTPYALVQYSYDDADRLQCAAVRMNSSVYGSLPGSACTLGTTGGQGADRISKNIYDAAGQLTQIQKAVGTALQQNYVTYTYSSNAKRASVTDANGNLANYTYDGFDRLVRWTFPSSTTSGQVNVSDYESYSYDANGNRETFRKRDGSTLSYTYDALNRVTLKTVPQRSGLPATHARSVYYSYDLLGHQLTARFDSASGEGVTNSYDALGRMITTTLAMDGASRSISYQYDQDGNQAQVTFPDGNYATYTYDGLDRPLSILRSGSATIAAYTYDNAGRRSDFNNNAVPANATVSTSYGYDAVGRLNVLTNNIANANAGANNAYSFSYNPVSQITQLTRSNGAFAYTGAYNVSRNYTTNGLNQYLTAGTASFGYDTNGNLTGDGSRTYLYDIENRLVMSSGATNATARYDPLGRIYEVTGTSGTTRFLYGGDALMAEFDVSGNLLRRYVHGADATADDPLVWYEGSAFGGSNERMLRSDWQGSIVLAADNAGQTVLGLNSYDENGVPGTGNVGRFQYTGQAWLSDLGLYYYKARFYSPTLARFLQTDPIGYDDQINLYAYVSNDPVNMRDPTGMVGCGDGDMSHICATARPLPSSSVMMPPSLLRVPDKSRQAPQKVDTQAPQKEDEGDEIVVTAREDDWTDCAMALGKAGLEGFLDPLAFAYGFGTATYEARNRVGSEDYGNRENRWVFKRSVGSAVRLGLKRFIPGYVQASIIGGGVNAVFELVGNPSCGIAKK